MNDFYFSDTEVSYRQSQLLRGAEAYQVARQLREARRSRATAELRPARTTRRPALLQARSIFDALWRGALPTGRSQRP